MADFWLGAIAGGATTALATVWLCFYLHRRHLLEQEAAAIKLEALQRIQYENDVRWRRRAAEWDQFAGQALTTPNRNHLLPLLPRHSTLHRD